MNIQANVDYFVNNPQHRIKAICNLILDACFVVKGIKVIASDNGLRVMMPSEKVTRHGISPDADDQFQYRDTAFPINEDIRKTINEAVLSAYEKALTELQHTTAEEKTSESINP